MLFGKRIFLLGGVVLPAILAFPGSCGLRRSLSSDPLVRWAEASGEATTNGASHEVDDDEVVAYLDRSLAWTKKYRRLVPYESARRTAMRLGLRSREEWEDIRQFGKAFHGAHSVSRPDLMYAKEWVSWEEFLGVMRPYEEAKRIVQDDLGLSSMEEYIAFVKEDTRRAEDLRIPAKPEIVYRDKGWQGDDDFFGTSPSLSSA